MVNIQSQFTNIGGKFITPIDELMAKLSNIKAYIFDWDGVFNNGSKVGNQGSNFAEPDAMGINMLKLDYWLHHGKLPHTFIVTGEENKTAQFLAGREHMNAAFYKCKFKMLALDRICKENDLKPDEIAFIFDDILDVELARSVGVSFQINRVANPLFNQYLVENKICDYRTGSTGGNGGVREVCELIIGLTGSLPQAIETRIEFKGNYSKYLSDRNKIETVCEPVE
ncbi:3-deoxy-D-manno-octulosonate 8-phosphate phosphatase (KDO 8-P phosphatase) [Saccharicrinis carchari]|uniref:3-deoxy-D-manno-octulosonate 8-phosphate phosphatase (KDO 8-P phosphatase) n=1 Tax=Saccharicrinis carchari TaxID=1168039 RepID=A0A521DF02_SACCC|nr:phosphatase [Saccharicrinis carchari]SMO70206.1 3-deoxy-D-manno-octulosonate 8-phosphate phosphatase (KDO 8-P phosphatase) [Saccharicrinis carchari]